MRNLLLLSALLITPVQAEKIFFEYDNPSKNQSTNIQGNAVVDVVTGDLSVSPVTDVFIVPSQPAVISINADKYQVEQGEVVNVNWQVAYGDSCVGSVESSSGSISNWPVSIDSSIGVHNTNITVNSFPAVLGITCQNYSAYQQSQTSYKELEISEIQESIVVGSPSIQSFKVNNSNSTTISVAGDVNVTWDVDDATSCTRSASPQNSDWSGNFNPNSSASRLVTISETSTLTLTCGNDSKQVSVTLNDIIPTGCENTVYPPNTNLVSYTYTGLKDGFNFGEETSGEVLFDLRNTEVASVDIGTLGNNFSRRVNFVTPPTDKNKTFINTLSVSTCPGDFDSNKTAVCVVNFEADQGTNILFTTDSSKPNYYCKMQPNQKYYFNFINKQVPYSTTEGTRCKNLSHTVCAIFFSESAD